MINSNNIIGEKKAAIILYVWTMAHQKYAVDVCATLSPTWYADFAAAGETGGANCKVGGVAPSQRSAEALGRVLHAAEEYANDGPHSVSWLYWTAVMTGF